MSDWLQISFSLYILRGVAEGETVVTPAPRDLREHYSPELFTITVQVWRGYLCVYNIIIEFMPRFWPQISSSAVTVSHAGNMSEPVVLLLLEEVCTLQTHSWHQNPSQLASYQEDWRDRSFLRQTCFPLVNMLAAFILLYLLAATPRHGDENPWIKADDGACVDAGLQQAPSLANDSWHHVNVCVYKLQVLNTDSRWSTQVINRCKLWWRWRFTKNNKQKTGMDRELPKHVVGLTQTKLLFVEYFERITKVKPEHRGLC